MTTASSPRKAILIADTFTASLANLDRSDRAEARYTALALFTAMPQRLLVCFDRLEGALDRSFWSARASRQSSLAIAVYRTAGNLILCYAGSQDQVLQWARHRTIQRFPVASAPQLVKRDESRVAIRKPAGLTLVAFKHYDAECHFRVMTEEAIARALDRPWAQWVVSLDSAQQAVVAREFDGPAWINGSAGTGKTVVALHRALRLARTHPDAKVLLATPEYGQARDLEAMLAVLAGDDDDLRSRITIDTLHSAVVGIYRKAGHQDGIACKSELETSLCHALTRTGGTRLSYRLVKDEWLRFAEERSLDCSSTDRDLGTVGSGVGLNVEERNLLSDILSLARRDLLDRGWTTYQTVLCRTTGLLTAEASPPFDFVVIDDVQNVNASEFQFLAALAAHRPNGLFLVGDGGQRTDVAPFSWLMAGVDVSGRTVNLRIDHRSSGPIRRLANRLLDTQIVDLDFVVQQRKGTISTFDGGKPVVRLAKDAQDEVRLVAAWLRDRIADGLLPHEIAIVDCSPGRDRGPAAVKTAGLTCLFDVGLSEKHPPYVSIGDLDKAKGMEFRAVAVIGCDAGVLPSSSIRRSPVRGSERSDAHLRERYKLYIACTRAKEFLLVTGVTPGSWYLLDLVPLLYRQPA